MQRKDIQRFFRTLRKNGIYARMGVDWQESAPPEDGDYVASLWFSEDTDEKYRDNVVVARYDGPKQYLDRVANLALQEDSIYLNEHPTSRVSSSDSGKISKNLIISSSPHHGSFTIRKMTEKEIQSWSNDPEKLREWDPYVILVTVRRGGESGTVAQEYLLGTTTEKYAPYKQYPILQTSMILLPRMFKTPEEAKEFIFDHEVYEDHFDTVNTDRTIEESGIPLTAAFSTTNVSVRHQ